MITSDQIRAARALLRWTAQDLADHALLAVSTINRMEQSDGVPKAATQNLLAVQRALEAGGVRFIPTNGGGPGVRLAKGAND